MAETKATPEDILEVTRQLGRPARNILAIAARCVCGRPLVVKTNPRLENGTPFPTLYYLTQSAATAAVSTLEASGIMMEYQSLLATDPEIAEKYQNAHEGYLAEREAIYDPNYDEGSLEDRSPEDYERWHALDNELAQMLAAGHVGIGVRW